MKKLFTLALIGSSFLFSSHPVKADWTNWGVTQSGSGSTRTMSIYKIDTSNNNSASLFGSKTFTNIGPGIEEGSVDFDRYDQAAGMIIFKRTNPSEEHSFNLLSGNWVNEGSPWTDSYSNTGERPIINKNADGSIQIGFNDIDITPEGLVIDGEPLITKKTNGELHIGKNSWITKEENGRQKVYAKDAAGNPIPIDYTNGTKLLINGRDVEQSINNVGALSAALTGLPTVPADTTIACGLGTGTHGGNIAFSGGCASKVNDKLSINYAASMNIPGQDYAGDFEDQFSARAGFVWKLGKATQPNLISMKENQKLTNEITDLKSENKKLNKKITKFVTENSELLARLERLEKIALSKTNSRDLATIKLP